MALLGFFSLAFYLNENRDRLDTVHFKYIWKDKLIIAILVLVSLRNRVKCNNVITVRFYVVFYLISPLLNIT